MVMAASGRRSYRWLVIALGAIVGVYAWYAITQYERLNDLNQRQLSNAAAELKTTLETALGTVSQFDQKWRTWKSRGTGSEPQVCDFDTSQPYLDTDRCGDGWSDGRVVRTIVTPRLGLSADAAQPRASTQFRFRIDKLLQELAFPDTFSLIFVATDVGVVLYQEAPTHRQWLRSLRWGERTFRDSHADRPPHLQMLSLRDAVAGDDAAWNRLRSSSSRISLDLGGRAHQLYLQPLLLDSGERTELLVGGAVPTSSIIRDALALDTRLLGVLVFLLLLGILGFPFMKLVFIDPHHRFRLGDVKLLYLSTGALLVLFTCASLAWDGYARWRAVADDGLAALARDLGEQFLDELTAIRDELSGYDRDVSDVRVRSCAAWPVQTGWFKDDLEPVRTAAEGRVPVVLPWPRTAIYLRQVSWIGPDGDQLWKSTADLTPGKTNVATRPYFRAVREGSLFQVRGAGAPLFVGPDRSITDGKFYTFVSIASGISDTLCPEMPAGRGAGVAAATVQLLSLDRQPLPAGYGFALVNREGRVLYHADRRLSLRENLFDELSQGYRARALMFSGHAGMLTSRYRERPHEFYFHPVAMNRAGEPAHAGFYLVAFRDTSAERTMVGHAFASGLAAPMMLLLCVYGASLFGITRLGRSAGRCWSAWLWPHGGLQRVYKVQTLALIAVLLGAIAAYLRFATVAAFLLCGLAAAVCGIGVYACVAPRDETRLRLEAPVWHTSAVLLALTCIVVVPTAALFQLSLAHAFANLIAAERASVAAQAVDVISAAENEAVAEHHSRSRSTGRAGDRRSYFTCLPAPYDAIDRIDQGALETRVPGVLRVAHRLGDEPLANPASRVRPRHVSCTGAPESPAGGIAHAAVTPLGGDIRFVDAVRWIGDVLPIVDMNLAPSRDDVPELSYSPGGTLITRVPVSAAAIAGFCLIAAALGWWIRWNTNSLFLADVDASTKVAGPRAPARAWAKLTPDQQMVLLQIACERIANPWQRPVVNELLRRGLLRLAPGLQPCSAEFDRFLAREAELRRGELVQWERLNLEHSWRYIRVVLVVVIAGLGGFLIATQPSLQSSLIAITTAVAGVLTSALKLHDTVAAWFAKRKAG